jgi:hypothetical protein
VQQLSGGGRRLLLSLGGGAPCTAVLCPRCLASRPCSPCSETRGSTNGEVENTSGDAYVGGWRVSGGGA